MLDNWGVTEENWHDALDPSRADGPTAPPGFAVSESPRYVGRGVAAIAADENRVALEPAVGHLRPSWPASTASPTSTAATGRLGVELRRSDLK